MEAPPATAARSSSTKPARRARASRPSNRSISATTSTAMSLSREHLVADGPPRLEVHQLDVPAGRLQAGDGEDGVVHPLHPDAVVVFRVVNRPEPLEGGLPEFLAGL